MSERVVSGRGSVGSGKVPVGGGQMMESDKRFFSEEDEAELAERLRGFDESVKSVSAAGFADYGKGGEYRITDETERAKNDKIDKENKRIDGEIVYKRRAIKAIKERVAAGNYAKKGDDGEYVVDTSNIPEGVRKEDYVKNPNKLEGEIFLLKKEKREVNGGRVELGAVYRRTDDRERGVGEIDEAVKVGHDDERYEANVAEMKRLDGKIGKLNGELATLEKEVSYGFIKRVFNPKGYVAKRVEYEKKKAEVKKLKEQRNKLQSENRGLDKKAREYQASDKARNAARMFDDVMLRGMYDKGILSKEEYKDAIRIKGASPEVWNGKYFEKMNAEGERYSKAEMKFRQYSDVKNMALEAYVGTEDGRRAKERFERGEISARAFYKGVEDKYREFFEKNFGDIEKRQNGIFAPTEQEDRMDGDKRFGELTEIYNALHKNMEMLPELLKDNETALRYLETMGNLWDMRGGSFYRGDNMSVEDQKRYVANVEEICERLSKDDLARLSPMVRERIKDYLKNKRDEARRDYESNRYRFTQTAGKNQNMYQSIGRGMQIGGEKEKLDDGGKIKAEFQKKIDYYQGRLDKFERSDAEQGKKSVNSEVMAIEDDCAKYTKEFGENSYQDEIDYFNEKARRNAGKKTRFEAEDNAWYESVGDFGKAGGKELANIDNVPYAGDINRMWVNERLAGVLDKANEDLSNLSGDELMLLRAYKNYVDSEGLNQYSSFAQRAGETAGASTYFMADMIVTGKLAGLALKGVTMARAMSWARKIEKVGEIGKMGKFDRMMYKAHQFGAKTVAGAYGDIAVNVEGRVPKVIRGFDGVAGDMWSGVLDGTVQNLVHPAGHIGKVQEQDNRMMLTEGRHLTGREKACIVMKNADEMYSETMFNRFNYKLFKPVGTAIEKWGTKTMKSLYERFAKNSGYMNKMGRQFSGYGGEVMEEYENGLMNGFWNWVFSDESADWDKHWKDEMPDFMETVVSFAPSMLLGYGVRGGIARHYGKQFKQERSGLYDALRSVDGLDDETANNMIQAFEAAESQEERQQYARAIQMAVASGMRSKEWMDTEKAMERAGDKVVRFVKAQVAAHEHAAETLEEWNKMSEEERAEKKRAALEAAVDAREAFNNGTFDERLEDMMKMERGTMAKIRQKKAAGEELNKREEEMLEKGKEEAVKQTMLSKSTKQKMEEIDARANEDGKVVSAKVGGKEVTVVSDNGNVAVVMDENGEKSQVSSDKLDDKREATADEMKAEVMKQEERKLQLSRMRQGRAIAVNGEIVRVVGAENADEAMAGAGMVVMNEKGEKRVLSWEELDGEGVKLDLIVPSGLKLGEDLEVTGYDSTGKIEISNKKRGEFSAVTEEELDALARQQTGKGIVELIESYSDVEEKREKAEREKKTRREKEIESFVKNARKTQKKGGAAAWIDEKIGKEKKRIEELKRDAEKASGDEKKQIEEMIAAREGNVEKMEEAKARIERNADVVRELIEKEGGSVKRLKMRLAEARERMRKWQEEMCRDGKTEGYSAKEAELAEVVRNYEEAIKETERAIREEAKLLEGRFGVKVDVVGTEAEMRKRLEDEGSRVRDDVNGFYSETSGRVVLCLERMDSVEMTDRIYVHEVVCHKGMMEWMGKDTYNAFCRRVFMEVMDDEARARFMAYAVKSLGETAEEEAVIVRAADEWLAHQGEQLAEELKTKDVSRLGGVFEQIRKLIEDVIGKIMGKETELTMSDCAEVIRLSAERLKSDQSSVVSDQTTDVEEGDQGSVVSGQTTGVEVEEKFDAEERELIKKAGMEGVDGRVVYVRTKKNGEKAEVVARVSVDKKSGLVTVKFDGAAGLGMNVKADCVDWSYQNDEEGAALQMDAFASNGYAKLGEIRIDANGGMYCTMLSAAGKAEYRMAYNPFTEDGAILSEGDVRKMVDEKKAEEKEAREEKKQEAAGTKEKEEAKKKGSAGAKKSAKQPTGKEMERLMQYYGIYNIEKKKFFGFRINDVGGKTITVKAKVTLSRVFDLHIEFVDEQGNPCKVPISRKMFDFPHDKMREYSNDGILYARSISLFQSIGYNSSVNLDSTSAYSKINPFLKDGMILDEIGMNIEKSEYEKVEKKREEKEKDIEETNAAGRSIRDNGKFQVGDKRMKALEEEINNRLHMSLDDKNNEALNIGESSGTVQPAWNGAYFASAKVGISSDMKRRFDELIDQINLSERGLKGHELLYEISKALGVRGESLDGSVYYKLTSNSKLRISDHYGNAKLFERHNENGDNYGLVIKLKNGVFRDSDVVKYLEYVYYEDKLSKRREIDIVDGLCKFLAGCGFECMPNPDKKHISPNMDHYSFSSDSYFEFSEANFDDLVFQYSEGLWERGHIKFDDFKVRMNKVFNDYFSDSKIYHIYGACLGIHKSTGVGDNNLIKPFLESFDYKQKQDAVNEYLAIKEFDEDEKYEEEVERLENVYYDVDKDEFILKRLIGSLIDDVIENLAFADIDFGSTGEDFDEGLRSILDECYLADEDKSMFEVAIRSVVTKREEEYIERRNELMRKFGVNFKDGEVYKGKDTFGSDASVFTDIYISVSEDNDSDEITVEFKSRIGKYNNQAKVKLRTEALELQFYKDRDSKFIDEVVRKCFYKSGYVFIDCIRYTNEGVLVSVLNKNYDSNIHSKENIYSFWVYANDVDLSKFIIREKESRIGKVAPNKGGNNNPVAKAKKQEGAGAKKSAKQTTGDAKAESGEERMVSDAEMEDLEGRIKALLAEKKKGDEAAKKPIGKGVFGYIYDGFKGRAKEAVDFLIDNEDGDLLGVFHRDEIGDIDLVYGDEKRGLKHIMDEHLYVDDADFKSIDDLARIIDECITDGEITKEGEAKVVFEKDGYKVVVSKNVDGVNKKWVLTAFDGTNGRGKKKETEPTGSVITPSGNEGGRAVASGSVSDGKGTKKVSDGKAKSVLELDYSGDENEFSQKDITFAIGTLVSPVIQEAKEDRVIMYILGEDKFDWKKYSKAKKNEIKGKALRLIEVAKNRSQELYQAGVEEVVNEFNDRYSGIKAEDAEAVVEEYGSKMVELIEEKDVLSRGSDYVAIRTIDGKIEGVMQIMQGLSAFKQNSDGGIGSVMQHYSLTEKDDDRLYEFYNFNNTDISLDDVKRCFPELMRYLLIDQSRSRAEGRDANVMWGTTEYEHIGDGFKRDDEILERCVTGENSKVIIPRSKKNAVAQKARTKDFAEVFTPASVVKKQLELIRESELKRYMQDWIREYGCDWWKGFIKSRRLEITCGEAPYIANRYDAANRKDNKPTNIGERVGMLDEKLRIVSNVCNTKADWVEWALWSLKNVYGYELLGDNVIIARENLLATFLDYYYNKFREMPTKSATIKAAEVISWNINQMDGLTGYLPNTKIKAIYKNWENDEISTQMSDASEEAHMERKRKGLRYSLDEESDEDIIGRADRIRGMEALHVDDVDRSKEELIDLYKDIKPIEKDGAMVVFFVKTFGKVYKDGGLFKRIVPELRELFDRAVFAYQNRDDQGGKMRKDGTIHKTHPNIDWFKNYVAKVEIDGSDYYVRFTVQEERGGRNGLHSAFVTDVALYENPAISLSALGSPKVRGTKGGIVDAKLEEFFRMADALREKISTGQHFSMDDGELQVLGTKYVRGVVERGHAKYEDVLAEMERVFGAEIRPYVKAFYAGAYMWPGMEKLRGEMTGMEELEKMAEDKVTEEENDGTYWNVNSGGVFRKGYVDNKKKVASDTADPTAPAASGASLQGAGDKSDKPAASNGDDVQLSDGKGTEKAADGQAAEEKKAEVPEWSADTAEDARKRGWRKDGEDRIVRQGNVEMTGLAKREEVNENGLHMSMEEDGIDNPEQFAEDVRRKRDELRAVIEDAKKHKYNVVKRIKADRAQDELDELQDLVEKGLRLGEPHHYEAGVMLPEGLHLTDDVRREIEELDNMIDRLKQHKLNLFKQWDLIDTEEERDQLVYDEENAAWDKYWAENGRETDEAEQPRESVQESNAGEAEDEVEGQQPGSAAEMIERNTRRRKAEKREAEEAFDEATGELLDEAEREGKEIEEAGEAYDFEGMGRMMGDVLRGAPEREGGESMIDYFERYGEWRKGERERLERFGEMKKRYEEMFDCRVPEMPEYDAAEMSVREYMDARFQYMRFGEDLRSVGEFNREQTRRIKAVNALVKLLFDNRKAVSDFQKRVCEIMKWEEMPTEYNVYEAMNHVSSRVAARVQDFERGEMLRLARAVAAISKEAEYEMESVEMEDGGKRRVKELKIGAWKPRLRWSAAVDDKMTEERRRRAGKELTALEVVELYLQAKDMIEMAKIARERGEEAVGRGMNEAGEIEEVEVMGYEGKSLGAVMAEDVIRKFEYAAGKERIKELEEAVRDATLYTLKEEMRGGIISKERYDEITMTGEDGVMRRRHYVPERGWAKEDYMDVSGFAKLTARAKGRETLATSPLKNIISMAQTAIQMAERNLALGKLWRLCNEHAEIGMKTGAFEMQQVYTYWQWVNEDEDFDDGDSKYYSDKGYFDAVDSYERITVKENEEMLEAREKIEELRKEKGRIRKYIESKRENYKLGEEGLLPNGVKEKRLSKEQKDRLYDDMDDIDEEIRNWRKVLTNVHKNKKDVDDGSGYRKESEQIVRVMVNGVRYDIKIEDARTARAMNGYNDKELAEKGIDLGALGYLNLRADFMQKPTRFLSSLKTQFNAVFSVMNLMRDVQLSAILNACEYSPKFAGKAVKNTFGGVRCIAKALMGDLAGYAKEGDEQNRMAELFTEFRDGGGITGYSFMKDAPELREMMARAVRNAERGKSREDGASWMRALLDEMGREGAKALGDVAKNGMEKTARVMSFMSELSELSVRFGQYKTMRDAQESDGRKDIDAAITSAKEVTVNFNTRGDISRILGPLFMFVNATLQGTWRIVKGICKSPQARRRILAAYGAHVLLGVLTSLLQPDDPDDETYVPDYLWKTHLVIGKVKIPLTHFFRTGYYLGANIGFMFSRKKSVGNCVFDIFNNFNEELLPACLYILNPTSWLKYNTARKGTGAIPLEFDWKMQAHNVMPAVVQPIVDVLLLNIDYTGGAIRKEPYNIFDAKSFNPVAYSMYDCDKRIVAMCEWLKMATGGKTNGKHDPMGISFNPSDVEYLYKAYLGGGVQESVGLVMNVWDCVDAMIEQDSEKLPEWNRVFLVNKLYKPFYRDGMAKSYYWELKQIYDSYDKYRKEINGSGDAELKREFIQSGESELIREMKRGGFNTIGKNIKAGKEVSDEEIERMVEWTREWNGN